MKLYLVAAFAFLQCLRSHATGKCGTVTIAEWGGMQPSQVQYLPRPVALAIVQHTVTDDCASDKECADIVKAIQSYHMIDLNWNNIGQNFLIGGNGKVYEGEGWLHVGAHTYGYNRRSIGVAFIGDFRNKEPTAAALQAAEDLLKCGVEKNYLTSDYKLVGHRQLIATESPGAHLQRLVKEWPHWTQNITNL